MVTLLVMVLKQIFQDNRIVNQYTAKKIKIYLMMLIEWSYKKTLDSLEETLILIKSFLCVQKSFPVIIRLAHNLFCRIKICIKAFNCETIKFNIFWIYTFIKYDRRGLSTKHLVNYFYLQMNKRYQSIQSCISIYVMLINKYMMYILVLQKC